VVRCPESIDLGSEEVVQFLHLLFEDLPLRDDPLVGRRYHRDTDHSFGSKFSALVTGHADAIVTFEFSADWAGHSGSKDCQRLRSGDQTA